MRIMTAAALEALQDKHEAAIELIEQRYKHKLEAQSDSFEGDIRALTTLTDTKLLNAQERYDDLRKDYDVLRTTCDELLEAVLEDGKKLREEIAPEPDLGPKRLTRREIVSRANIAMASKQSSRGTKA